jgi:hypothetical protein
MQSKSEIVSERNRFHVVRGKKTVSPFSVFLMATLVLPLTAASDQHEASTDVSGFEYIYKAGNFGEHSVGQQVMVSAYSPETSFQTAAIETIQVQMSRTAAALTEGGQVCVFVRSPVGSPIQQVCEPINNVPTSPGLVAFQFSPSNYYDLRLEPGTYTGTNAREFWVTYSGSCTDCVKVYRSNADVYRPSQVAGVNYNNPGGFTLAGWDISFAMKIDHTPIMKTLAPSPAPAVTATGVAATLQGYNFEDGGVGGANVRLEWGLWQNNQQAGYESSSCNWVASGTVCAIPVSGLLQHQTYYNRACGTGIWYLGEQCGNYQFFTTPNQLPTSVNNFIGPDWATLGGAVYFSAVSNDPLDLLRYELDVNGDGQRDSWSDNSYSSDYPGSVGHAFNTAGTYSVRIRACDNSPPSGACSAWSNARSILIDGIAPNEPNLHSTTGHASGVWSTNNDPAFAWTESDAGGSGIQGSYHWFDDSQFYAGGTPHTSVSYTDISDGDHQFKLRIYDRAGNSVFRSFATRIDTIPPSLAEPQVLSGTQGTDNWYTSDVQLDIASVDNGVGVQCERYASSPTGPWQPVNDLASDLCSGDAAWQFPGEGILTYYGAAKDGTNKTRIGSESLQVKVDKTPPTGVAATVTSGTLGDNGWYKNNVNVDIASSDSISGIVCEQYRQQGTQAWLPVTCVPNQTFTQTAQNTIDYEIRAINGAGLESQNTIRVKIDKNPPSNAAPVPTGTLGTNGWYTSPIAFAITSADPISGVRCEQHGPSSSGPWTPIDSNCSPSDAWTHNSEGSFTYWGKATDQAGWTRSQDSVTIKLDMTPPTVTDNQPDQSWTNINPVMDVDFGDALSGISKIEYAIWTGPAQSGTQTKAFTQFFSTTADGTSSYTQPWQVADLAQGTNYITARVTDRAGLTTTVNDVALIQWDTVPPSKATPTIVSGNQGDNLWYTNNVGLSIDSADSTAGIASEWHGQVPGQWSGGSPADVWTDSIEGTTTWYGRALDLAANEYTSGGIPVKIDKVNPVIALKLDGITGNNGWYTTNVDATLNLTDGTSGPALIGSKLDAGSWATTPAVSITTIPVTGDGIHPFSYYGKDAAGRGHGSQSVPLVQNIKIDRTNPVSSHTLTGAPGLNGWHTTAVEAVVTASDSTSGPALIHYKIDDGSWTSTTSSSLSVNFTVAGLHSLFYFAEDQAGNVDGSQATPKVVTIKVDLSNPATSKALVGTLGTSGWYTTPVTVTLSAVDAPSSLVQAINYGLDAGATTPSAYVDPLVIATEGTHSLAYRATDASGRVENLQQTTIKVDVNTPELGAWTQSPPDVTGGLSTPVTVAVDADGGASGLLSVKGRYSYNGGAAWSAWTTMAASGNRYTLTIPPSGAGWWTTKDQTLHYQVEAVDNAGNRIVESQTDLVDRLPPTLSVQLPQAGMYWGLGLQTIMFRASDADHDTVTYTIRLSGDGGASYPTTLFTDIVNEDGALNLYSYNWDTASATDGNNYAVRIEANDGRFVTSKVIKPIIIDRTVPSVVLTSPEAGRLTANGNVIVDPQGQTRVAGQSTTLQATADDGTGTGIAFVRFQVDGVTKGEDYTPDGAGLYAVVWTHQLDFGRHTVSAQAFDYADNASPKFNRDVIVIQDAFKPNTSTLPTGVAR